MKVLNNKIKSSVFIIGIILFCPIKPNYDTCAVTYQLNGGRLGDNILSYVRAKWTSLKYQMPFFYTPFPYSNQFIFSQIEVPWSESREQRNLYSRKLTLHTLECPPSANTLFILIYGRSTKEFHRYMMEDPLFKHEIRSKLQPIQSIELPSLPADKISVALHVRKGTGVDRPAGSLQLYDSSEIVQATGKEGLYYGHYKDYEEPTKLPPDQYYIDQLKNLSLFLKDASLFVYIFTDDPNPKEIVSRYERALNKPNIVFQCRCENNAHNKNVIEDLFFMASFDCLIRGESNFSWAAEILGNHKIIIFPKSGKWIKDRVIIDSVDIIFKDENRNIFEYYTQLSEMEYDKIISLLT